MQKNKKQYRTMLLTLSGPLATHIVQELESPKFRLPSSSLLYDSRITFDLASMLWAREMIFSRSADRLKPWIVHLRTDSSPQFGRDYLVVQCDVVRYGRNTSESSISKRLLPIQCVGSRAGKASQKLSKLVHALSLESEHVSWHTSLCVQFFIFIVILVKATQALIIW